MYKNLIIGIMTIVLFCGAFAPNSRWAIFDKDKTMIDKNHVLCVFETEHQFATTYEERQKEKPKKCVQVVLSSGESFYSDCISYEEMKTELLKDR